MKSMCSVGAVAGVAAALFSCAHALSAFQVTQAATPNARTPGSVEGHVVNAITGEPVRRANLTLSPNGGHAAPLSAQTDDKGQFRFPEVEPGTYRLRGEKAGFLRQNYGARLNPDLGADVQVTAGRALADLKFPLLPGSVISGQVLDQEGEPMPTLMVSVLRYQYGNGKRDWKQVGGVQTNDRGEFRVANLRAGRYLVCATDVNLGIGLAGITKGPLPDKPEQAYGSTYSGNTTEIARAVPFDLGVGEDRRGANIQLVRTAAVRLRGRVSNAPDGKTLIAMLLRRGASFSSGAPGGVGLVQPADGAFEMRGLLPGSYLLMVRSATEISSSTGAPLPIEIGDQNIDGLDYRLTPGSDVTASVTVAGEPDGAKNATLTLEMVDFQLPDDLHGRIGEDGLFRIRNVGAGKFRLRITGLPDNALVQTVKAGGQEVDPEVIEWKGSDGKLEIVVARTAATMEGKVAFADGRPAAFAVVTVMPDSRRQTDYHYTLTNRDGLFSMKGIRPGKYKVLAWEDIESGAYTDSDFVKPFEAAAQTLAFPAGGKLQANLTAIPIEKVTGKQ